MDNLTKLRYWSFKILPLVYDDSLSYYEVLTKVTAKVNELVNSNNTMPQAITDEITKQLNESYATDINNKINSAVNDVTENANNQIDKLANEVYAKLTTAVATDEGTNTFTKDAKIGGELIFLNSTLYKVTAVMPAGTNYIVGTNIVPINISEELKTIKETYISSNNEHWNERSNNNYNAGIYLLWKDILYITTKDIHTNDILYADSDNQNLKQVTLASEIINVQKQIYKNDNGIDNLQRNLAQETSRATNRENIIDGRISNIVAQSGNDNTEIVDARIGYDGTTYDTLGTAIRKQVSELKDDINNVNINLNNAIKHNYSINLLENVNPTLGYTYSANATGDNNYSADANGAIYPVINIINGKTYSYASIRASFSSVLYNNGTRLRFDNDDGKFTATDNGKLFLSVRKNDVGNAKFYEGDIYTEQGYFVNELKIYESDIIKNNIIHVGSTRAIKGFIEAINKSKDGDIIIFDAEDYDIAEELGENWLNNYTYESKGYGFYIGSGKKFIFPYGATVKFHYTGNNAQVHEFFSPINAGQGDFELIGLHLSAKNCRYCVHDERATNDIFYRHTFKNCHFEMDNSKNPNWNSKQCIGGGLGVNGIINVEDCIFNSVGGTYDLSYHNSKSNLAKSFISITNSWFENSCRFSWYGDSQRITSILFNGNSVKEPITVSEEGTGTDSPYKNISVKQWNNEIRADYSTHSDSK